MDAKNFLNYINSLGIHDVPLDKASTIEWLFENDLYASFISFIQENVSADNILTPEELNRYEKFQKDGCSLLPSDELEKECEKAGLLVDSSKFDGDPLEWNERLSLEVSSQQAELNELHSFAEFCRSEENCLKSCNQKRKTFRNNLIKDLKTAFVLYESEVQDMLKEIKELQVFLNQHESMNDSGFGEGNSSIFPEKKFFDEVEDMVKPIDEWITELLKYKFDMESLQANEAVSVQINQWNAASYVLHEYNTKKLDLQMQNAGLEEAILKLEHLEKQLTLKEFEKDQLISDEDYEEIALSLDGKISELKSSVSTKNMALYERDSLLLSNYLLEHVCHQNENFNEILCKVYNYLMERTAMMVISDQKIKSVCSGYQKHINQLNEVKKWAKVVSLYFQKRKPILHSISRDICTNSNETALNNLAELLSRLNVVPGKADLVKVADFLVNLSENCSKVQDELGKQVTSIKKMDEIDGLMVAVNEITSVLQERNKWEKTLNELEESVRHISNEFEKNKEKIESDDVLKIERSLWVEYCLDPQKTKKAMQKFIESGQSSALRHFRIK